MLFIQNLTTSNVDQLRYWLELAYFASGVILAVFAAFGLRQLILAKQSLKIAAEGLRTTKNDIQIRVKREAVVIAAKQCEKFAEEVIPNYADGIATAANSGVKVFTWVLLDDNFDEETIKEKDEASEWIQQLRKVKEAQRALLRVLNQHEAFAMYFAHGAADEEMAYPAVGTVFCDHIRVLAPLLISLRMHEKPKISSGLFQNTIDLYVLWSNRAKHASLEAAANVHESVASKSREEAAALKIRRIPPIGTEEDG
jgi:predicted peroxiredoxin